MNFFKKIGSLFSSSGDRRSLWLYVKCGKCGEIMKGRVDLFNDLSIDYEEGDGGISYICRKVFIGSNRCYSPIEVKLTFDKNRSVVGEEITGGEIVREEDYLKANPKASA